MYISAMRRSKFSGVYSFSTDWTGNNRKNHYFVWELSDGAFAVQELNKAFQPLTEPERISASSFTKNFRAEPEILAMPIMTPDLSHLEANEKPAAAANTAQQATQAGTAASGASGETTLPQKASAATSASLGGITSGGASGATPGVATAKTADKASVAQKNFAQGGTQAAPQAATRPRDAHLFANESDNLAASVSQNAAIAGAQRPQQARSLAPESLRPVAADAPEGLKRVAALPKKEAAVTPPRTPQLRMQPVDKELSATAPERRLQPGASPSAMSRPTDLEAMRKAKMAEARLRETFRQTLLRLRRPRERKAALMALEQLAQSTEDVSTAHKHMFRDFGVSLRQNSQLALALLFSRRVVELAPDDDHAHFNLARILCSLGQFDEAAAHVRTAMNVGGEEPLYFRMLVHIRKEMLQKRGRSASRDR